MRKLIIFVLALILLTGCTVNSSVSVNNDNTVDERVVVIGDISSIPSDENVDMYVSKLVKLYGMTDYKRVITRKHRNVYITFTKKHSDFCEYVSRSYFVNAQANSSKCDAKLKEYSIDLKKTYEECTDCLEEEEEVRVNYKILNNNILNSNADSKKGSYHVWTFDSDDNKNVVLKIKRHIVFKDLFGRFIWIPILILLLLVVIIGYRLYRKYQNNQMDY